MRDVRRVRAFDGCPGLCAVSAPPARTARARAGCLAPGTPQQRVGFGPLGRARLVPVQARTTEQCAYPPALPGSRRVDLPRLAGALAMAVPFWRALRARYAFEKHEPFGGKRNAAPLF
ncbi:hypothetical protein [Hyalangium sp.]|uniref:hypothetical protein n=1 Tax=Hyalangium sp. TaxID=2028555 RepID=UPI002D79F9A3|nr:hypothetical protein [Hyalangium sp.]